MKKVLFLLIATTLFVSVQAQSPFKRMPHPVQNMSAVFGVSSTHDTIALRFTAPTATYLYPQRQVGTSLGFGINWEHYNYSTQTWYVDKSIVAAIIAAGNTVPNANNVMSIGIFGGILNQKLLVGPIYNLPSGGNPKGSFGVGFNIGISLN